MQHNVYYLLFRQKINCFREVTGVNDIIGETWLTFIPYILSRGEYRVS